MEIFLLFFFLTLTIGLISCGNDSGKKNKNHSFIAIAIIINIIYNIFMGVSDATGATERERNKMRGKSD